MDTLQAALTRLAGHHPLQAHDLASGYNLLLRGRRFGQAQTLLTHHDAGNTIPAVNFIPLANHERNALTAWRSVPGTLEMREYAVELAPLQVIVISGCHFSRDAARDIATDLTLAPVFAEHSLWLGLPPGDQDIGALVAWNRLHPSLPLRAISSRAPWHFLPEQWETPTFLVVRDGNVVDQVQGWRSADPRYRQQLMELLQRHGLLE